MIILELLMLGYRGVEVIREIKRRNRNLKIVVITASEKIDTVYSAIYAGADGFIVKEGWHGEFEKALGRLRHGEIYIDSRFDGKLAEGFAKNYVGRDQNSRIKLTRREGEALKLIVEGFSNKEIGERMAISVRTAEKHRANILKKLKTNKTTYLVKYGLQTGVIGLYEQ